MMTAIFPTRRTLVAAGLGTIASGLTLKSRPAHAATRIRLQLSWFAEAEYGGFYQALAKGFYAKAGLDVEILQGGPQVNALQLLLAGETDLLIGYDVQVLNAVEKGLPVRAIAASFQVDLQGLMAHQDVASLAALKGHHIYIANSGYSSYWPWLKMKFGYTDDMAAPKGTNLQTFFADPTSAVAGYITSEPFIAQQRNVPAKFLLFSNEGWPVYTNPIVTTNGFLAANPEVTRSFLRASMEGWKDYLADPAAGNAQIKTVNPKMTDDQIAFSLKKLHELKAAESGDASTQGLGIITEARWRRTRDTFVDLGLLKSGTDWKQAFTTDFIKDIRVTM